MKTFLEKTAKYIIENYGDSIDNTCIILPNRRAGLFLKKNLTIQAKRTIWSPAIYSIEDFIVKLSGFSIIDPVYLQFDLYEVHKEIEGPSANEFSEFLKWGSVLLNDFNEIDMYLVDPHQVFGHLSDDKALALWNPDGTPLSDFQIKYLRFYGSLKEYYDKLIKKLLNKKQVYQGLAYRKLAENMDEIGELPWKQILFVGFNALTKSEEVIIRNLDKNESVELIWDSDSYYLDNEIQEAGYFIRKHRKNFGGNDFNWIENYFSEDEKNIKVIGVAKNTGQVKTTGKLLDKLSHQYSDLKNTAVVLNDESLTIPLLSSIPEKINEFNLTMGLPLNTSPLFLIIDLVFNLQVNILKFDQTNGKNPRLYFRDIIRILEHPYFNFFNKGQDDVSIAEKLKKSNKVFISYEELKTDYFYEGIFTESFTTEIFKPWNNDPQFGIDCIISLLKSLQNVYTKKSEKDSDHQLELEYLFHFSKVTNKLKVLLVEYPIISDIKTLRELMNQVVQSVSMPFYGEPLRGLQVMGMLETRTLDFENIIMLSVNEGFIPSGKSEVSLVPFEIKKSYGLPTYQERNKVFAYHFYRILQRAKNIYLLYNTQPGDLSGGDKSRFLSQIIYELPKYNSKIRINEEILSIPPILNGLDTKIVIEKSQDILDKLRKLAQKGFSASSLNIYRNCKLQFYFNHVVGLEETDEVEETIEVSTMGKVAHEVLQILYEPFLGKNLLPDDIKKMKPRIEDLLAESFRKNYENGDVDFGKNLLIVKVAGIFVKRFLDKEIELLKYLNKRGDSIIVKGLEQRIETYLDLQIKNLDKPVKLKGFVDRLDELGNTIRIIDYKTGNVLPGDLKMKDWEILADESKLDKCFQLLLYAYIYSRATVIKPERISSGIISLKNLSLGFMGIELPEKESMSGEVLKKFEDILNDIISEIYNPEIPFTQVDNQDNCVYCSFKSLCGRN